MRNPYYTFNQFLEERYGRQLHRVPVDLGFGCPNRDTDGRGGCTFCPQTGARAQQTLNSATIEDQVRDAIEFARRRYRARGFIAYIQGYTGTFASASIQRREYERVLGLFDFDAVSIGTRPDCLDDETLSFLEELKEDHDVWVELGIQTVHDSTLIRVNRGHSWACSREAVHKLHQRGIQVAAHIILGLPGEGPAEFNATADELAELPIAGLKLHNLHVVEGTELARRFAAQPFPLLSEYEYLDAVIDFLRRTPAHVPIMRLQTDTPRNELIAPNWSLDKGRFLELVARHMQWRMHRQGDLCETTGSSCEPASPVATNDGSITFWSSDFKEHYHTTAGARGEARHKYVDAGGLEDLLRNRPARILDVCFGLGYNTLAALEVARRVNSANLHVVALEIDRRVVWNSIRNQIGLDQTILQALFDDAVYHDNCATVKMIWGDARHAIEQAGSHFDLIFLDAFSTQRNSELWTVEFFRKLKRVMAPDAKILTYCAALPVRAGLIQAGLHVGDTIPFGRERPGTIAALTPDAVKHPIPERELQAIRTTTKGIPYHDPTNISTNRDILRTREEAVRQFKDAMSI